MADFQPIQLGENDKVTAEIFNRMQRAVAEAINDQASDSVNVSKVTSGDYRVGANDMFVLADASGGAVRVILPDPTAKRFLTVKKSVDSKNKVTIVGQNGSPSLEVFFGADRSVTMLADGEAWGQL